MARWGYTGPLRSLTGGVSEESVRGIPAIGRAVRVRATAVATLDFCMWRGYGPERTKVTNVWQARLFQQAPNEYQTSFGFWETIEESLCYRGNAYVWKLVDPMTGRAIELYALHPDQVECLSAEEYRITVAKGYLDPLGRGDGQYVVSDDTILHIRGHGNGGTLVAPSPIELYRETFNSALERQRHETKMWERGTSLRLAVEFPENVTETQAQAWRQMWRETYEGAGGETTAIIGGGATIKPISMTAEDAAFVDMANLTVEDAARIMGVPANWLGGKTESAGLFEQDLAMWLRLDLGPELDRIEDAFRSDEQLFGPDPPNAASVYPKFDTEMFIRGDLMTEAKILVQLVQAGILLPDEARRVRGLEDLPGGIGQIPQITPVGGAPNPNTEEPPPIPSPDDQED